MVELEAISQSFPAWKAIIWCFYPITCLILIQLIVNIFDNDDHDDGKFIPVYQGVQS
tara:strand:- start:472 stop:642 length:171 start_codon:yes stop_codon:yes gene_type:complete